MNRIHFQFPHFALILIKLQIIFDYKLLIMPIILIIKYMFIANAYLMMLVKCYYFINIIYFFSKFIHFLTKDKFELHLFFAFIQMLINVNQIQFYIKLKISKLLNQIY